MGGILTLIALNFQPSGILRCSASVQEQLNHIRSLMRACVLQRGSAITVSRFDISSSIKQEFDDSNVPCDYGTMQGRLTAFISMREVRSVGY